MEEFLINTFGLAEDISKQPVIDYVAWLWVAIIMQIFKEKEQAEKKMQNTKYTGWGENEHPEKSLKKSLMLPVVDWMRMSYRLHVWMLGP